MLARRKKCDMSILLVVGQGDRARDPPCCPVIYTEKREPTSQPDNLFRSSNQHFPPDQCLANLAGVVTTVNRLSEVRRGVNSAPRPARGRGRRAAPRRTSP